MLLIAVTSCNSDDNKSESTETTTTDTKDEKNTDADIPATVKTAFEQKYPKADKVKWEMDSSNYKVKFKMDDIKYSNVYNAAGSVLEAETRLEITALPQPVAKAISAQFPGYTIKKVDQSDRAGKMVYEVEIDKDTATWDVHFSPAGEVIKKSKELKKDKDDE